MKTLISLLVVAFMATACGTNNEDNYNTPEDNRSGIKQVILDNDFGFSDPDNDGMLSVALKLHNLKYIDIIALGRVGQDFQNNGTLIAEAQLVYHGISLPIGMNQSTSMRQNLCIGSTNSPTASSVYEGNYTDIREFGVACSDNSLGCGRRDEVSAVYCEALAASDGNVSIVSGGQAYNVYETLKACPTIFKSKVNSIAFLWSSSSTQLSGQDFGGDRYTMESVKYIVDNSGDIELIETIPDNLRNTYHKLPNSRVGGIYLDYHANSPIAFVYGLEHPYGVGLIDGYSIIDIVPLLYTVFGKTLPDGTELYIDKPRVTFKANSSGASVSEGTDKNHYKLDTTEDNWSNMTNFIRAIIRSEYGKTI